MNTKTFLITINLMAFILAMAISSAQAQKKVEKRKLNPIWIEQEYGVQPKGYLYQVEEKGVVISSSGNQDDYFYRANQLNYLDIKATDIQTIKIRKPGSVGGGVMIGAVGGFLVGLTIGLLQGDDEVNPNCWLYCDYSPRTGLDKGLATGVSLGLLGGITGAIIGSAKIKIPINGNRDICLLYTSDAADDLYTV